MQSGFSLGPEGGKPAQEAWGGGGVRRRGELTCTRTTPRGTARWRECGSGANRCVFLRALEAMAEV